MINENRAEGKFVNTIGRVTYLNMKPKFRKINIEDANKETIDLILWEEVEEQIIMGKVYKFNTLRIKQM